ncbi:DUF488 domain-containing protein [Nonlabens antarcticus]|uniref:DUF488 domain-containing protein n=1 Tax=Nonlabens antarcticus TaxID=392714 RepID=UPI001891989B|nr:DUF488 domain-containing protein [Nonlabens antarcticus]
MKKNTIYTIGHSTRSLEDFMSMLNSFKVKVVADVRRFPGSRKYPQFNQESLKSSLEEAGIEYIHMLDLGGRRKARKDTKNTTWNNVSFRGYADYMETEEFENAVSKLEVIALKQTTVYMCSEAVWWRCHRSMVSDYLMAKGWEVLHIMGIDKSQEHKYTAPANVYEQKVSYAEEDRTE